MTSSLIHHPFIRFFDKAVIVFAVLFSMNIATFFLVGNAVPTGGEFIEQDNPLARLGWYPIYLSVVIMVLLYFKETASSLIYNPLLYLVLFLTIASVIFSVAPDVTVRRIFALVMTIALGVYLGARPNWLETLQFIGLACALATLLHLFVIITMPGTGIHNDVNAGAWKGVFFEKNALGASVAQSAIIITALVHLDKKHRLLWLGALFLTLVILVGAQSTTSLIAFAVTGALYVGLAVSRDRPWLRITGLYFGAVAIAVPMFVVTFAPELVFEAIGKDATLTGRTDIWEMAITAIETRPWTGYGYAAFWQEEFGPSYIFAAELEWLVPNAHNTWIEQGLNMGVPGIIALALLTLWSLIRAIYKVVKHELILPLAVMIQLLLFTISESTILWAHNTFTCALFVFVSVLACRPLGRENDERARVRREALSSIRGYQYS